MKRKRYNEEQIVRILSEVEAGQTVEETSRKYGVSEQSIYRWKENARLKKIVAEQAVDIDALKDLLGKKW